MDRYIVIGLGVFGRNLALKLIERGAEVVAVDSKMELIEQISDKVTYAACLDATDEKSLQGLNLGEFEAAAVCIGEDFEANLLTCVLLKQNGVPRVVTRASNPTHVKILKAVGIDQIITPEVEAAERLANSLIHARLLDLTVIGDTTAIAKVAAPPAFVGKTIESLKLRTKYGVNVIAIHKMTSKDGKDTREETKNANPSAETIIEASDILVVIGDSANLRKL